MWAIFPWYKEELSLVKVNLQVMGSRPSADVYQTFWGECCNQGAVVRGEREEYSVVSIAMMGKNVWCDYRAQ